MSTSQLARVSYPQTGYSHQGWLTEDHRYFLMNDELDETAFNTNTRTHIWDVADLDSPTYVGFHESQIATRDHDLYVHNGLIYQANYTSGLRILSPTDLSGGILTEVGYFDTYPTDDSKTTFNGAWSVYPFFESGSIIVSDRQNGLFVLDANAAVREPGSFGLLSLGLIAFCMRRKRMKGSRQV